MDDSYSSLQKMAHNAVEPFIHTSRRKKCPEEKIGGQRDPSPKKLELKCRVRLSGIPTDFRSWKTDISFAGVSQTTGIQAGKKQ